MPYELMKANDCSRVLQEYTLKTNYLVKRNVVTSVEKCLVPTSQFVRTLIGSQLVWQRMFVTYLPYSSHVQMQTVPQGCLPLT